MVGENGKKTFSVGVSEISLAPFLSLKPRKENVNQTQEESILD